jgi:PAS domain S-box-containing protein
MLKISNKPDSFDIYGLLVDASIDSVMALDAEWRIIAWNRATEIITGVSGIDVLGRPLLEVVPALKRDEEFLQALRMALNGHKSFLFLDHHFEHSNFYETPGKCSITCL